MLCVRIVHTPADTMYALVNRHTHMIDSHIHLHLYILKIFCQVRSRAVFDFLTPIQVMLRTTKLAKAHYSVLFMEWR
jgi:hypothetical protein